MKFIKCPIMVLIAVYLFSSFKNKEITWVAIGDSITYLNDHTNETGNRVTKGYLTGVVEQLTNLHYINKGYNGWTSGNIAEQLDNLGLIKADVYSIFLGTNDWWQGRPVGRLDNYKNNQGNSTVYGSFRIIINKLRKLNPQAQILLITPMQRADFVYINDAKNNAYGSYKPKNGQELERFANAIDSIGRYEHIQVVDLYHNKKLRLKDMVHFKRLKNPSSGTYRDYKYPQSTAIPFHPEADEYPYPKTAVNLTFDGLHPSDKGNAIIANAIVTCFKQLALSVMPPEQLSVDTLTHRWAKYINLKTYTKPFWTTDTITDETVQVIRNGESTITPLLFKATKILSVKAANYKEIYVKGKDWDFKNGKLIIGLVSKIPFFHIEDLIFNQEIPGNSMGGKTHGTYVLFNEGTYFSARQIAVTNVKEKTEKWQGPVPGFAADALPNTLTKLQSGKNLKILFYGNSIEVGYNASGLEKVAPYMPVWPELLIDNLHRHYPCKIFSVNKSVAGRLAKWGLDSVAQKVTAEKPDLVIIGFGMNDGTLKVPADVYRKQIKGIIDAVNIKYPDTEFILIAPMLANPASAFDGLQATYKAELDQLAGKGIVVADITGVYRELLKHKSYQDMTGNNINHPNDYLARWYAQFISGMLIK